MNSPTANTYVSVLCVTMISTSFVRAALAVAAGGCAGGTRGVGGFTGSLHLLGSTGALVFIPVKGGRLNEK